MKRGTGMSSEKILQKMQKHAQGLLLFCPQQVGTRVTTCENRLAQEGTLTGAEDAGRPGVPGRAR